MGNFLIQISETKASPHSFGTCQNSGHRGLLLCMLPQIPFCFCNFHVIHWRTVLFRCKYIYVEQFKRSAKPNSNNGELYAPECLFNASVAAAAAVAML